MRAALFATYTYAEFVVVGLAFLPFMAVSKLRHRKDPVQRMPGRWMRRFGKTTSRLTPLWRFRAEGEGPRDIFERGYVVVSNHESNADPFLLCYLPWDMRWIAKEELFEQPFVGWLMRLSGDIPLRRGERDSVVEMLAECRRTLRAGMPVMIFPEGTRSKTADLLPFKDGAFRLAIETGCPILPLALSGTRDCMRKGSILLHRATAVVRVLEPISTTGLGPDDVEALKQKTRERILAARAELQQRRVEPAPTSARDTACTAYP